MGFLIALTLFRDVLGELFAPPVLQEPVGGRSGGYDKLEVNFLYRVGTP